MPNPSTLRSGGVSSRWNRGSLVLGVILLVAAILRLHSIGSQSVWIDEAYSLRVVAQPVSSMIDETARDNHPPLYYLLLAAWMHLGPGSDAWARLLSAALGVSFVAVFYVFCREVVQDPDARVATALLAISPLAVWHSQDARMYSLLLLTVYAALTLLLVYLRRSSPLVLVGFVLTLDLALYTHVYAAFVFPTIVLYLLAVRRTLPAGRIRTIVLGLCAAGLGYLPWVWVVYSTAMHRAGYYKPIGVLSVPYAIYAFSVGYSLGPSVAELHRGFRSFSLVPDQIGVVALTSLVFGVSFLLGLLGLKRCRPGMDRLLLLLFGVPLLMPVLVTLNSRIDFNVRYAAISFPAYLVLLSLGLRFRPGLRWNGVLAGGIVLLMGWSLVNLYTDETYSKEDARGAAEWIRARGEPQDCVLVIGINSAFDYYRGSAARSEWLDFRGEDRLAGTEATLSRWSHQCPRLWFVAGRTWEDDPLDLATPTLLKYFERVDQTHLTGIQIVEFRPRAIEGLGEIVEPRGRDFKSVAAVSNLQSRRPESAPRSLARTR